MRRETEAYEVMINRFYGTIFGKLSRMKQNMTLENCAKALSWPRATEPLFAHECKISSSQVLGGSVAKLLLEYYPQELHGTAELFEKWINFLIAWMYEIKKKLWSSVNLSYNHSKVLMMKDFIVWNMYF